MQAVGSPLMIYTEETPNPESLKFVTNRMLYEGTADFRDEMKAEEWSPLATELFLLPYVRGVYICNNFVTVTKQFHFEWDEIMIRTKNFIKKYIDDGKEIIKDGYKEVFESAKQEEQQVYFDGDEGELVMKIIEILDTRIKPAVSMDGGNVEFKAYEDGVVTVLMQGSCSGCPSSIITVKAGIEQMLKQAFPHIKEVIAEMD